MLQSLPVFFAADPYLSSRSQLKVSRPTEFPDSPVVTLTTLFADCLVICVISSLNCKFHVGGDAVFLVHCICTAEHSA